VNRPIFRLVVAYMLWKARGRVVDLRELVDGSDTSFDLGTSESRGRAFIRLVAAMDAKKMKIPEKNRLAAEIGARLGADYEDIARARLFTIMVPEEVRTLAAAGISFELHTHTHGTPQGAEHFETEIATNRLAIQAMTGLNPRHFCYPSGRYRPEFLPWLQERAVVSATTCDPGLASNRSNPLLLPRFVDVNGLTSIEFEGWVSGAASFLSRQRSYAQIAQ
jgi:hypothetical protein